MARLLSRLGTFAHHHRLAVVLAWIVLLIGGTLGAMTLSGKTSDTFSIPGKESTVALEQITKDFGAGGGASATVVLQAPAGQTLTSAENSTAVTTMVAALGQLPGVVAASDPWAGTSAVSPDRSTAYSRVTYSTPSEQMTVGQQDALMAAVDQARSAGLTAEVTGTALDDRGSKPIIGEIVGIVVALLVLALTYGSLVAAGMTLLTAAVGVGLGILGITVMTGFIGLSSTTPALAGMLGLAVGIDYALFIVSRFRQELRRLGDVGAALAVAVGTAGSAVVTAGVTVVIALSGLAVVGIPFLTQMGLAAAATIVVSVAVAVTLVPATLSYLGRRALPKRVRATLPTATPPPQVAHTREGFLHNWVMLVTRRRVLAVLLTVTTLGVLSLPVMSMQTTLIKPPAEGTTQARADQLLTGAFGEGFTGPLTILFQGHGATQLATAATPAITAVGDVAAVGAPTPNATDTAALVSVIPRSGPSSAQTQALVPTLRTALADTPGEVAVTGATAVSVDTATAVNSALPVYLMLVVGLAFILLVLVFRSLLVPLVGVLGFLLTLGAALGTSVAVFQWGWLAGLFGVTSTGPLISLAPILIVGILFGLAMDYQIFLVSRMHEAHQHGRSPVSSIRHGFRQAAPVVVAAALIMFGVFAGFAASGDGTVKSIAFGLAVGILVDAFLVRMVLVPAALAMIGEQAWWLPGWLQWLPTLDVEGTALEKATDTDERPAAQDHQPQQVDALR